MLFLSKRDNSSGQSNTEACVSILGLILAIGLIGGLGALIYGLIKGNSSGTIGGGVVLGISVFFSIIFALVFVFCLKNNDVDSNINEQRSHTSQHQHNQNHHQQQNRQIKHEQTSSHEITVISGVHKYDNHPQQQHQHQHQQQSNEYGGKMISPPYQSGGLTDSTNSGYGKQGPQSPSKAYSFTFLNQSNGSINNQNPQSMIYANMKRNDYNRH